MQPLKNLKIFFKGCLSQIILGALWNTLSHLMKTIAKDLIRNSRLEMFCIKCVLKIVVKFTKNPLLWHFFLVKQLVRTVTLLRKEYRRRYFLGSFAILQNTVTGCFWYLLVVYSKLNKLSFQLSSKLIIFQMC